MSNARSPREVCSTTIGTSGLMVLALSRFLGRNPSTAGRSVGRIAGAGTIPAARGESSSGERPSDRVQNRSRQGPANAGSASATGRPELAGALLGRLLPRCPKLLPRLRLLDGDRLGLAHDQVDRLTGGEVAAGALEPIGLAQLLEQLLRSGA